MDFDKLLSKGTYEPLTKPKGPDRDIATLLTQIQTPWYTSQATKSHEGYLYKKQRSKGGFKLYYFVLSGNTLYYYRDNKSKKPRGVISVSFVSPLLEMTEAQLIKMNTPSVSKHNMEIYSHNRLDVVCAQSDLELDQWVAALQKVIKDNLLPEDFEERSLAVQKLIPLMAKKSANDLNKIIMILSELEMSGLASGKLKKLKSGNLDMMIEEDASKAGSPSATGGVVPSSSPSSSSSSSAASPPTEKWVKYYFVLSGDVIYYYKTTKSPPKGVITIKFSHIDRNQDDRAMFRIVTPISMFVLRAKHDVAAEDWIEAIMAVKNGKLPKSTPEKDGLLSGAGDQEFSDISEDVSTSYEGFGKKSQAQLLIYPESGESEKLSSKEKAKIKPRVVKVMPGSSTIGRSDSCAIKLDDRKVSRSHAKFEITEAQAFLLDLGSGHGTKVNKKEISRHLLRHGDRIKIGKTRMVFEIVKK